MRDKFCIAFPGREALIKGMDQSFFNHYKIIKAVFEEASDYLRIKLHKICYEDINIKKQWKTICLVTHCYAIYKVIEKEYGIPSALLGYSQGEFTACTAAGVFHFPEVLRLIYKLEELLLSEYIQSECMYRFIDIDAKILEELCEKIDPSHNNVFISAYISKSQNIVSGKNKYVEKLVKLAKKSGARWAINLNSDRAYHSKLCERVAILSKNYFQSMELYHANIPVFSCLDGEISYNKTEICNKLSRQIDHPIQWNKMVNNLIGGQNIMNLYEIGPGCTVSANSRLINDNLTCRWIGSVNDI